MTAYEPGWCKRYSQPVTAVGFRQGECRGEAMNSYLGSQVDPGTQETREVYGMRLELKLSLDIYAPASVGAAGCDKTLEGLHQVMLEGAALRPAAVGAAVGGDGLGSGYRHVSPAGQPELRRLLHRRRHRGGRTAV